MPASPAHIAGVGVSRGEHTVGESAGIEAGVKALLDAGVSYGEIDHSFACFIDDQLRIPPKCFDTLGVKGAAVSVVDNHSGLNTAVQYIRSGQANCVLVLGVDRDLDRASNQTAAVGVVLVSDLILNSHAYLRDSAVNIAACCLTNRIHSRQSGGADHARASQTVVQTALREANLVARYMQIIEIRDGSNRRAEQVLEGIGSSRIRRPKSLEFSGVAGWLGLCGTVWQLRGWSHDQPVLHAKNGLLYTSNADGAASAVILCRSDGRVSPAWKDVKDVREGRERLGYNPAMQNMPISREDLESVKTAEEFTLDDAIPRPELSIKGGDRAALARL